MSQVAIGNRQVFDYNHSSDVQYKQLREQAQFHFRNHKQLSSQSQSSYKNGNKAEAKRLSDQSHQEFIRFQQLNNQAAEWVFVENNKDSMSNEIDLHGLYVSEAEYVIKKRLIYGHTHNEQDVRIIVGKGKHSSGGIAKIKPAAEQLCNEAKFQWQIDSKNDGVIIVNTLSGNIPNKWYKDIESANTDTGVQHQQQQQQPQTYQPQQQMQYAPQQQQQNNNNNNNNNYVVRSLLKLLCICIQRNI
ncbi:hypothetical protein C6P45_003315 [Maudiozyma exigua]|uniref:Smr domain-containing protein n=1 Tax=Maudiozyma exigua TaxID=34358 RepID=A0A9P6WD30_MAUEX|nr:hypothetical protein C6P45_003315 [Kazachstania exigua]